jgi:hypothetical protein
MSFLASPRKRRRASIAAIVVVVAAPLIFVGIHFSTPGSAGNANGPYVKNAASTRSRSTFRSRPKIAAPCARRSRTSSGRLSPAAA